MTHVRSTSIATRGGTARGFVRVRTRGAGARGGARARSRGIALVAALWLTVLLTVIASSFAYSMRGEALSARNALSSAQARAAADGAVERTAFELARPRGHVEAWAPDGSTHSWRDGEVALTATAVDESAKIDVNVAAEALLKGLIANVGGADTDTAQRALDGILDWRDPDDLKRPSGAEVDDYRAAGRKYRPRNGAFESVGELRRVIGMTPEIFDRISGSLTVYSRQPGINAATASREVLLALPNATPEAVDAFLQQRGQALKDKLPPPPFPPATGFWAPAVPVWRIRAEAVMPDGVTFVRDAVLRPSADVRQPVVALLWQEGDRAPPATESASATATESASVSLPASAPIRAGAGAQSDGPGNR